MKRIYSPKQRFGSRLRRARVINQAGARWPVHRPEAVKTGDVDDLSPEELVAFGWLHDVLTWDGWPGWEHRQQQAVAWLRSRPGVEEAARRSIEEVD